MRSCSIRRGVRCAAALVLAIVACAVVPWATPARADLREEYRYKFPCPAGNDCAVTQTQHINNALDFDLGGSAYQGTIRSMSEGSVYALHFDADHCTWPDQHGLGLWAQVVDIFGKVNVYGHMASFSVDAGQALLQGDPLGTEGNTGYSEECAVHLHWEPGGSLPTYIDGVETPSLCAPCWYTSTNAPGGEIWGYFAPFPAIRDRYIYNGGWILGWTHDVGRPGLPFPQGLYVHSYRVWGWEQTFANNPWYTWPIELGLYTGVWDQAVSQLIEQRYWQPWNTGALLRGVYRSVSLPLADTDACPPGSVSTCAGYQRFHLGYIWNDWSAVIYPAVWCPDVSPHYPSRDNRVNITDVYAVALRMGTSQGQPGYDPWYDINGDGYINITDVYLVAMVLDIWCYPT